MHKDTDAYTDTGNDDDDDDDDDVHAGGYPHMKGDACPDPTARLATGTSTLRTFNP
jgi:hypothetical protein